MPNCPRNAQDSCCLPAPGTRPAAIPSVPPSGLLPEGRSDIPYIRNDPAQSVTTLAHSPNMRKVRRKSDNAAVIRNHDAVGVINPLGHGPDGAFRLHIDHISVRAVPRLDDSQTVVRHRRRIISVIILENGRLLRFGIVERRIIARLYNLVVPLLLRFIRSRNPFSAGADVRPQVTPLARFQSNSSQLPSYNWQGVIVWTSCPTYLTSPSFQ